MENNISEVKEGSVSLALFLVAIVLTGLYLQGCMVDAHLGLTPVSESSHKIEYKPKKMHLRCLFGQCDEAQQVGEGS